MQHCSKQLKDDQNKNKAGNRTREASQDSRKRKTGQGSRTRNKRHSSDCNRSDPGSRQHGLVKQRNERTKQWLWRYRDAKKEVLSTEEQYAELIEMQAGTQAIQYSGMPKGGNSQADLSDLITQRDELQEKVLEARQKQIQAFREIWDSIHQLPIADEVSIMTYRYIRMMKWKEICTAIGKEWAQVHRHHARALQQIGDVIDMKYK